MQFKLGQLELTWKNFTANLHFIGLHCFLNATCKFTESYVDTSFLSTTLISSKKQEPIEEIMYPDTRVCCSLDSLDQFIVRRLKVESKGRICNSAVNMNANVHLEYVSLLKNFWIVGQKSSRVDSNTDLLYLLRLGYNEQHSDSNLILWGSQHHFPVRFPRPRPSWHLRYSLQSPS